MTSREQLFDYAEKYLDYEGSTARMSTLPETEWQSMQWNSFYFLLQRSQNGSINREDDGLSFMGYKKTLSYWLSLKAPPSMESTLRLSETFTKSCQDETPRKSTERGYVSSGQFTWSQWLLCCNCRLEWLDLPPYSPYIAHLDIIFRYYLQGVET